MAEVSKADADAADFRAKLGTRLILWATVALVALAAVVMVGATYSALSPGGDKDAVLRTAQLLFSALLPLFATWVGTVLAFYFTKENYQAATQGTLDIMKVVGQRLAATRIADVMMPRSAIVFLPVPAGGLGAISLADVEAKFTILGANGGRVSRLHFFGDRGNAIAMMHRSVWAEMLIAGLREAPPVDMKAGTLAGLIAKPYPTSAGKTFEDFIKSTIAFTAIDRTLAEAKAAMEAKSGCQDVIITQNGSPEEPVLGWVSNIDIARLSQAS